MQHGAVSRGGHSQNTGDPYGNEGDHQSNQSEGRRPDTSTFVCFLCGNTGHKSKFCPWKSGKDPCGTCTLSHPRGSCPFRQQQGNAVTVSPSTEETEYQHCGSAVVCSAMKECTGQLHLESGQINSTSCSVLRDTGTTVCGVRKTFVKKNQFLGSSVKCVTFGGKVEEFPLAKVEVQSPYLTGMITCCVLEAPVADLIIGNIPRVSDQHVKQQTTTHEPVRHEPVTHESVRHEPLRHEPVRSEPVRPPHRRIRCQSVRHQPDKHRNQPVNHSWHTGVHRGSTGTDSRFRKPNPATFTSELPTHWVHKRQFRWPRSSLAPTV